MEWLFFVGVLLVIAHLRGNRSDHPSGTVSPSKIFLAKQGYGERRISRKLIAIEKPDIEPNEEMKEIISLLEDSNKNVFLTGKAGTGKSTFLKYFRATTKKNVVVVAPTGVAALNVQGQTIHSFFNFGIDITPESVRVTYDDRIYKHLDLLIIDEISMVRADLFDCIDRFMRLNGRDANLPFGGAQVFVIGDLFQLPPIVKNEEEKKFNTLYKSPFFFDSNVYQNADFKTVELTRTYRQTDKAFIDSLDAIRVSNFTKQHLDLINTRVVSGYERSANEFIISLVPTNNAARQINVSELEKLSGQIRTYHGTINGSFKEKNLPTDLDLNLKEGAQVILLKNDPTGKWANGDIAKVIQLGDTSVRVMFDDESFDDIGTQKWDELKFVLNEESGRIEPEVVGTFTQIPLKLAWAVTIHKGQGKTFDRVHIHMGNGAFAPGQTYVALSRCRTLEGTVLSCPVEPHHVFSDNRVKQFMKNVTGSVSQSVESLQNGTDAPF